MFNDFDTTVVNFNNIDDYKNLNYENRLDSSILALQENKERINKHKDMIKSKVAVLLFDDTHVQNINNIKYFDIASDNAFLTIADLTRETLQLDNVNLIVLF